MLVLSIVTALVIISVLRQRDQVRGRLFTPLVFIPFIFAFIVEASFFMLSWARISQSNLFDLLQSNTHATSPFTSLLSGGFASVRNLGLMALSAFFYCVLAGWFWLGGYMASRAKGVLQGPFRQVVFGLLAVIFGGAAFLFTRTLFNFEMQYRSIPVVYVLAGATALAGYVRSGRSIKDLQLFVLSLFSFLVVIRILLHVHAWHYGFYILVPGIIVCHAFFFRKLPGFLKDRITAVAVSLGFGFVFMVFMLDHAAFSRNMYKARTLKVAALRGELGTFNDPRGAGVAALVKFLEEKTDKNATVAVFPEGLTVNFLSARRNPLYYYSYLPVDMVSPRVEDQMIADMELKTPDHVIILQRDVAEYGSLGFGVDYAQRLVAYIEKNYALENQHGPLPFTADSFSAVILKRKH